MEVKSFTGPSDVAELEKAIGQYVLYHDVLAEREPDRVLYLAIPQETLIDIFEEPIGQLMLKNSRVRLIVFDSSQEALAQWIP